MGGDASAVKRGSDFLAFDRWETEWQQAIFEHGGVWQRPIRWKLASIPKCLLEISRLR
jgi:hypothetical protein